jgi:hypothetical protein
MSGCTSIVGLVGKPSQFVLLFMSSPSPWQKGGGSAPQLANQQGWYNVIGFRICISRMPYC